MENSELVLLYDFLWLLVICTSIVVITYRIIKSMECNKDYSSDKPAPKTPKSKTEVPPPIRGSDNGKTFTFGNDVYTITKGLLPPLATKIEFFNSIILKMKKNDSILFYSGDDASIFKSCLSKAGCLYEETLVEDSTRPESTYRIFLRDTSDF